MTDSASTFNQSRIRARIAILAELRKFIPDDIRLTPNNNSALLHMVVLNAGKHESIPYEDGWSEVFQLISQGVILPIPRETYIDPSNNPMRGSGALYFVISESGKRFLRQTIDRPDPYIAESILKPLESLNIFNETVRIYIPEACRALEAKANIGAIVLIGVAAESVTEQMYASFSDHLSGAEKSNFDGLIKGQKRSAEARWIMFTDRFPSKHSKCIGEVLKIQFDNILEPLTKIFRQNRNDAAHQRATLISEEIAQLAVSSFVPFGKVAAQIVSALKTSCNASI